MQGMASLRHLGQVGAALGIDALRFGLGYVRSRTTLAAENLSLRKQLALYREREVTPRRATDATRLVLVLLAQVFAWRDALLLVQPATLLRWHRQAFRLLWRWWSRTQGRPRLPSEPSGQGDFARCGLPSISRAGSPGAEWRAFCSRLPTLCTNSGSGTPTAGADGADRIPRDASVSVGDAAPDIHARPGWRARRNGIS